MPLALGISGYSGAGKTTLIEALLPRLVARGWRVGVLKHDAHKLRLDHPGKDTARFYDAGAAAVCAHDPAQRFVRRRSAEPWAFSDMLVDVPADLDLVLVEGHKRAPLPKLVLEHPEPGEPIEGAEVIATLPWSDLDARVALAEPLVVEWVERAWNERPVGVAVLVGGQSRRMQHHKALLEIEGRTLLERLVDQLRSLAAPMMLVGAGPIPTSLRAELPVLPDAPGLGGPIAGLLALLRHDPRSAWLVLGCDQPQLGEEHTRWLLGHRRPGSWVVTPRLPERSRSEPLGALYEPELRPHLERCAAKGAHALYRVLQDAPKSEPVPEPDLRAGWLNVNTPAQWQTLTGQPPRELRS